MIGTRVMTAMTADRLQGLILGFALVGVLLTGWLVASELFGEPTCPELLGVPACYIVLAAYLVAVAGAWSLGTVTGNALLLAGAGLVTLIGAWFSVAELTGAASCPTFEGLPMCYVSLLAGATMLMADQLRRRASRYSASPMTPSQE